MASFRIDPELEHRLRQAAERSGVSVSVFIRDAVEQRCDQILGRSLLEELGSSVGAVESGRSDSRRTGRAFADLLQSKRRKAR